MSYPDHLKYTEHDEWVSPAENGKAKAGVSWFAQKELGDIAFVELPAVGSTFAQGDVFGTIESVKAASDLFMPVSGTVTAVNDELVDNDQWAWVNEDPYGKGWLIEIEVSNPADYDNLQNAADYSAAKG